MRKSLGFTLAEVLITLAIIGVVAAMTIPSVIVNTNQQEFKTGLKKAVSVLNQAITMNIALENVSPTDLTADTYDVSKTDNLMGYLAQRLNIIKSTILNNGASQNLAFYTADGMRFEFGSQAPNGLNAKGSKCGTGVTDAGVDPTTGAATTMAPCLVIVDVNGDKRPNPTANNNYVFPPKEGNRINDLFTIMVTDTAAIPWGSVAQRTMFQND